MNPNSVEIVYGFVEENMKDVQAQINSNSSVTDISMLILNFQSEDIVFNQIVELKSTLRELSGVYEEAIP